MDEQKPEPIDLADELRELGRQIKDAIRVAREHPQTKEFERQVTQAVNDLGKEIDRAVRTAGQDQHVRQVGDQMKQAAQTIKGSSAGQDIERGLAKGMRALNEQIRRAIEEAEKQPREPGASTEPPHTPTPPDADQE